jgi:hypothetical protein
MSVIEAKVAQHDTRLTQQEERLRLYAETKYVDGQLKPFELAITRFSATFDHITERLDDVVEVQKTLAKGQEAQVAIYNQLLRERGERENREHEKKIELLEAKLKAANERGFFKSIRENVIPLLVVIATFATVAGILLALIKAYVLNAPK